MKQINRLQLHIQVITKNIMHLAAILCITFISIARHGFATGR
jgi:NADH:ubiquinone oxidoreductase subunit 6 (subunit J)